MHQAAIGLLLSLIMRHGQGLAPSLLSACGMPAQRLPEGNPPNGAMARGGATIFLGRPREVMPQPPRAALGTASQPEPHTPQRGVLFLSFFQSHLCATDDCNMLGCNCNSPVA